MKVELSGVATIEIDIEWSKTINISKEDVVKALDKDEDEKADWRDDIERYVNWLKDEENWADDIEHNVQFDCYADKTEVDGWSTNSPRMDRVDINY